MTKTATQVEAELASLLQAMAFTYADGQRPTDQHAADMKRIGQELNAIGGMELMQAALQRATEPHFEYYERLSGFCDHSWNGIGGWLA
ncbi:MULTISPECIES: hypothetical protein [unclassified Bradyrhizobium]|uniref:hypothetical protein n=1 Tax=unclassified Bradyrhizobium TaxID=2631580 RepID=UPI0029165A6B|nr:MULTISPECIES: hypothetical protein [unclassified Bradyrhizobium]